MKRSWEEIVLQLGHAREAQIAARWHIRLAAAECRELLTRQSLARASVGVAAGLARRRYVVVRVRMRNPKACAALLAEVNSIESKLFKG